MQPTLCPVQQAALDRLTELWPSHPVLILSGHSGRTTVLRALHERMGGELLTARDLAQAGAERHPLDLEESFSRLLRDALDRSPVVFLDDFELLAEVVGGCYQYPRGQWINAHLEALALTLKESGKRLVLTYGGCGPSRLNLAAARVTISYFEPVDYAFFGRQGLGAEVAERIDFAKIHRFAPYLNCYQLTSSCRELAVRPDIGTEEFIAYLRENELATNVALDEVQNVRLQDLKGVDEVVRALETHIVLPLENDDLSRALQLKPKRGVLLAGPPGTGKTTVGRALAHRLQGKFFKLDGTYIPGTDQFYYSVRNVFEQAKQNAPSVIFIDDADVIFGDGQETGFYRFLLTMLDGLESARAGRVCVILTAMEVDQLPAALLRSGRAELWLEMHLPDAAHRGDILRFHLANLPEVLGPVDIDQLAARTAGCTGADLKRLAEDARNLLAFDTARNGPMRPVTEYFLEALATLRVNQERYGRLKAGEKSLGFEVGEGARGSVVPIGVHRETKDSLFAEQLSLPTT
jgi:predicted AAA+ superfamily ATPase